MSDAMDAATKKGGGLGGMLGGLFGGEINNSSKFKSPKSFSTLKLSK
jgi:hypothetical protein